MHPPLSNVTRAWARVAVDRNLGLRRGAWYPVTRLTKDQAFLKVAKVATEPRPVPRRFVQTRVSRPLLWSVVPRPSDATRLPSDWGERYGVCPNCLTRGPIPDYVPELRCSHCRAMFAVGWDERYLWKGESDT